jgi:hypothetical protein
VHAEVSGVSPIGVSGTSTGLAVALAVGGGSKWGVRACVRYPNSGAAAGRAGAQLSMFGLGPATRIYPAAGAIDMPKSFAGLNRLLRDHL